MIVVTGATGNVGRALVEVLDAAGEQLRTVSRGALPAARHHRADLMQPASLRPAMDGARALFLVVPGAPVDPDAIVDVAKDAGVRQVVLLSSQGVVNRPSHAPLRHLEEVVQRSGLEWTILRIGGLASNAYAWADSVRESRTVAAPYGDVGLPVVDPADVAEVAAVVLRSAGHGDRIHELTGPTLSTPRQRAAALGEALGEPVRFREQTRDEARAQMLRFMPEPVVDGTLAVLGEPAPAELQLSPAVEHLLGRPPHPFTHWAERHIQAFK